MTSKLKVKDKRFQEFSRCVVDVEFMRKNPLYFWFAFSIVIFSGHKVYREYLELLKDLLKVFALLDTESLAQFSFNLYKILEHDSKRLSFARKFKLSGADVARVYSVLNNHIHVLIESDGDIFKTGAFSSLPANLVGDILEAISLDYLKLIYPGFIVDISAVLTNEYLKDLHRAVRSFATIISIRNALVFEKEFLEIVSQQDKNAILQIQKLVSIKTVGVVKKISTDIQFIAKPQDVNKRIIVFKKIYNKNFKISKDWLESVDYLANLLDIHNWVSLKQAQLTKFATKVFDDIVDILKDYPESVCRQLFIDWASKQLE